MEQLRSPYGLPSRPQLRCLVGRADGRPANALPCNRPLEYGGSYLSKKSGIALQFTFSKRFHGLLSWTIPWGLSSFTCRSMKLSAPSRVSVIHPL